MPLPWVGRDLTFVGRDVLAVASWGWQRRALHELPFAVSHADPDAVRFVSDDIPRFWEALGAIRAGRRAAATLERLYFTPGTPGLREFRHRRPNGFASLPAKVHRCAAFYDSVRHATLKLHASEGWREQTRAAFRSIKQLLPDARFPDVYLTMGGLFTGGTAGLNGLLLCAEFFAAGEATITGELNAWERDALRDARELPFLATHELAHALQRRANPHFTRPTLLDRCLEEGTADYLAYLATGELPRTAYFRHGVQHEREVWRDFTRAMRGHRVGDWLYQGRYRRGRPADLGYFVGFRIAQAYLECSQNQDEALNELLNIHDQWALLKASGYSGCLASRF